MEPILSLKNVCSYYDKVQVLYDINVDVYPGEIVSVIGANGAGKSTMMKTIMGLVHMGRGQVTFDGKKLNRMHAHKICKAGCPPHGGRIPAAGQGYRRRTSQTPERRRRTQILRHRPR